MRVAAILKGDYDRIHDPELQAVAKWVIMNRTAHSASSDDVPFSWKDAPEMMGTALTFHYMNRMANVFLGDSLLPIPSAFKGITYRLYAATAGKRIIRPLHAGKSLKLIPKTQLPEDLSWAVGNPDIAAAFAGFSKAIEEAGDSVLPETVRSLVAERIQSWDGITMGISRHWVEEAAAQTRVEHQAVVRLILLTAFASYQVDAEVIYDFRKHYPDDAQLIAATAWASWTAARRVGSWVTLPT